MELGRGWEERAGVMGEARRRLGRDGRGRGVAMGAVPRKGVLIWRKR